MVKPKIAAPGNGSGVKRTHLDGGTMTVQYSGNLLVKVRNRPFAGLLAGPQPLAIPGYRLAPLFKAHHATAMFAAAQPADHWLTATASAGSDLHP